MHKIPKPTGVLVDTVAKPGDFPLGSVESRAAARAAIAPEPCISVIYGRDCDEQIRFAEVPDLNGAIYERLSGETFRQFTSRIVNLPGRDTGGLLTFFHRTRPNRIRNAR